MSNITITIDADDLRAQLQNYDRWYRNRLDVMDRGYQGEKLKRGEDTKSSNEYGNACKSMGIFFLAYLKENGIYDKSNGGILSSLLMQDTNP